MGKKPSDEAEALPFEQLRLRSERALAESLAWRDALNTALAALRRTMRCSTVLHQEMSQVAKPV